MIQNTERLKSLYGQVDSDSGDEIRKKYLMVAKERNIYFGKLRDLEQLGETNNWGDPSGLLQKILFEMNRRKSKEIRGDGFGEDNS